ncbi:unnamed protein product, partial [Dovyalis caffra]
MVDRTLIVEEDQKEIIQEFQANKPRPNFLVKVGRSSGIKKVKKDDVGSKKNEANKVVRVKCGRMNPKNYL